MGDREEKYEKAKRRAKAKIEFLQHLISYAVVVGFLAFVNYRTSGGYQWWLWVAFGWGIGIVTHFFRVYAFKGTAFEDRMIEREMELLDDRDQDLR